MSKKAFTLAEMLLALTVMGIVASLTIPILMQNTNQAVLKRDFSNLSQAALLIRNEVGGTLANAFPGNQLGSEALKEAFKQKLSYLKDCSGSSSFGGNVAGGASAGNCWHADNAWKLGDGTGEHAMDRPGLILNNGTLLYFEMVKSDCSNQTGDYKSCGIIYFDVSGFKTPNTFGKDIFAVNITENEIIPWGAKKYAENTCTDGGTGYGCASVYLYQ